MHNIRGETEGVERPEKKEKIKISADNKKAVGSKSQLIGN